MTFSPEDLGEARERAALVVLDRATDWTDCYSTSGKTAPEALQSLEEFVGSNVAVTSFYFDNPLKAVCHLVAKGARAALILRYWHETSAAVFFHEHCQ